MSQQQAFKVASWVVTQLGIALKLIKRIYWPH